MALSKPTTNIFEWRDAFPDSKEMGFLVDLAEHCGAQLEWHTPCREISTKIHIVLGATVSFDAVDASDVECGALLTIAYEDDTNLDSPLAHLRVSQVEGNTIWAMVEEVFEDEDNG